MNIGVILLIVLVLSIRSCYVVYYDAKFSESVSRLPKKIRSLSSSSKKKYAVSNNTSKIVRKTTQLTRIEEASDEIDAAENLSNASNNLSTDGDSDVFETEPIIKTDEKIASSS